MRLDELSTLVRLPRRAKLESSSRCVINIDLLKYRKHLLSEEYLNMLYSNNLLPLITKPTRLTHHTSNLIDHIYKNSNLSVDAGIALVDISDHLPVFCILDRQISRFRRASYFRDYSNFDVDQYIRDKVK